jgi:hypothetical protein
MNCKQGQRERNKVWSKGYHTIEKMMLPNGEYGNVLIWHEDKK